MKVRLDISPAHLTVLTIPRSTDETHHRLCHRHHHRHHRRLYREGNTPLNKPLPLLPRGLPPYRPRDVFFVQPRHDARLFFCIYAHSTIMSVSPLRGIFMLGVFRLSKLGRSPSPLLA